MYHYRSRVALLFLQLVYGDGTLNLKIVSVANPLGLEIGGSCCDITPAPVCLSTCDTYVTACASDLKANSEECYNSKNTPTFKSRVYDDTLFINLPEAAKDSPFYYNNPMKISFVQWQVSCNFICTFFVRKAIKSCDRENTLRCIRQENIIQTMPTRI